MQPKNNVAIISKRSNTEFGLVFTFVFLIISVFPCISFKDPNNLFLTLSIFTFSISIINPMILSTPNKVWIKLGFFLGYITTPILLFIFYVVLFIPIGSILKILNKDSLNLIFEDSSTWIKRKQDMQSLKNQF